MEIYYFKQPVTNLVEAHLTCVPLHGICTPEGHIISRPWITNTNLPRIENIFITTPDIDFRGFIRKLDLILKIQSVEKSHFHLPRHITPESLKELKEAEWTDGCPDVFIWEMFGLMKKGEYQKLPQGIPIILQTKYELSDRIITGLTSNINRMGDKLLETSNENEFDQILEIAKFNPLFKITKTLIGRYNSIRLEGVHRNLDNAIRLEHLIKDIEQEINQASIKKEQK